MGGPQGNITVHVEKSNCNFYLSCVQIPIITSNHVCYICFALVIPDSAITDNVVGNDIKAPKCLQLSQHCHVIVIAQSQMTCCSFVVPSNTSKYTPCTGYLFNFIYR